MEKDTSPQSLIPSPVQKDTSFKKPSVKRFQASQLPLTTEENQPPPLPPRTRRPQEPPSQYEANLLRSVAMQKTAKKKYVLQQRPSFSLADPTQLSIMLQQHEYNEVELSFGVFTYGKERDKFIPSIQGSAFEAFLDAFRDRSEIQISQFQDIFLTKDPDSPHHTQVLLGQKSKRIIHHLDPVTNMITRTDYQTKYRAWQNLQVIRDRIWGYTIHKSKETSDVEFTEIHPDMRGAQTRDKWTYVFASSSYHIYLSMVTFRAMGSTSPIPKISYELEIERTSDSARIEELTELANFCLMIMNGGIQPFPSLDEKSSVVSRIYDVLRMTPPPDNPLKMPGGWWDRPVDLDRSSLMGIFQPYAAGVKYDGVRKFLFFDEEGTYLFYPPFDIIRIFRSVSHLAGTLLDGEYIKMTNSWTFYAFDILFHAGRDVRRNDLVSRQAIIAELISSNASSGVGFLKSKPFFTDGGMYENINRAVESTVPPGVSVDGYILTPMGGYKEGRTYKWKLPELRSVDFFVIEADASSKATVREKVENGEWDLGGPITDESNVVLLLLLDEDKSKEQQIVRSVSAMLVDNFIWTDRIVECLGTLVTTRSGNSFLQFRPFRIRYDKTHPNTVQHAQPMFKSISKPLELDTLLGKDDVLFSKCLRSLKVHTLETFAKDKTLLDIGTSIKTLGKLRDWSGKLTLVESIPSEHQKLSEEAAKWNLDVDIFDSLAEVKGHMDVVCLFLSGQEYLDDETKFGELIAELDDMLLEGGIFIWVTDTPQGTLTSRMEAAGYSLEQILDGRHSGSWTKEHYTRSGGPLGGVPPSNLCALPPQAQLKMDSVTRHVFMRTKPNPFPITSIVNVSKLDLESIPIGETKELTLFGRKLWVMGCDRGPSSLIFAAMLASRKDFQAKNLAAQKKTMWGLREWIKRIELSEFESHLTTGTAETYYTKLTSLNTTYDPEDAWALEKLTECCVYVVLENWDILPSLCGRSRNVFLLKAGDMEYYPISTRGSDKFKLDKKQTAECLEVLKGIAEGSVVAAVQPSGVPIAQPSEPIPVQPVAKKLFPSPPATPPGSPQQKIAQSEEVQEPKIGDVEAQSVQEPPQEPTQSESPPWIPPGDTPQQVPQKEVKVAQNEEPIEKQGPTLFLLTYKKGNRNLTDGIYDSEDKAEARGQQLASVVKSFKSYSVTRYILNKSYA
jgi:hypothetical protein